MIQARLSKSRCASAAGKYTVLPSQFMTTRDNPVPEGDKTVFLVPSCQSERGRHERSVVSLQVRDINPSSVTRAQETKSDHVIFVFFSPSKDQDPTSPHVRWTIGRPETESLGSPLFGQSVSTIRVARIPQVSKLIRKTVG